MALIARCSGDIDAAWKAAWNNDAADAAVIFAPGLVPEALPSGRDGRIWGAGGIPLRPETVALWRGAGADFTVSPLAGALVDAIDIANPGAGMTHGARIPDEADDAVWRILAGIPLDFLVLDQSALTGRWTLTRLGAGGQRRPARRQTPGGAGGRAAHGQRAAGPAAGRRRGRRGGGQRLGAAGMAQLKADLLALPPPATPRPASRRF